MSQLSRRVIKAMSVFGGVQVINILCSIVRNKFVSVWIGAAGVGLFGVYNTAVEFISQLTMLGIGYTGTRDIAAHCDDALRCQRVVTIVRRWTLWLAVGGALLTFFAAPWLGEWSFGDTEHTWAFQLLSLSVFLLGLSNGRTSVLQGLGHFKKIARSTLWGSVGGTIIAIPLFYFLGIKSIVPVILITTLALFVGVWVNRDRSIRSLPLRAEEVWKGGRSLIHLGFFITLSTVFSLGASYVLIAWFTNVYGSGTAGLYQAGFTLVSRYVGIVFSAISMEFFPRLSGVARRDMMCEVYVGHELVIALAVLVPVIGAFSAAAPLIIRFFYSSAFEPALPFIAIGIGGTIFRCISWCMAYVMLVRGDGKIYLLTEAASSVAYIIINILVFKTYGFAGMGFAYIAWYLLYTVIVGLVFRYRYNLRLRSGIPLYLVAAVVATAVIISVNMLCGWIPAAGLSLLSAIVSLRILRRKFT